MIRFSNFNSLFSLIIYFSNEAICQQAIIESRWPDGDIVCPYCGKHHCKRYKKRFHCTQCNRNFSCTVGTIFENTKDSLLKWFMAMYLISSHKKGISSHQLSRDIKVTQKTVWYMAQKIRTLMPQTDEVSFDGYVECDEVYIGGKEKWKHKSMHTPHTQGRSTITKTPVFGMLQRTVFINEKDEEEPMSYVHAFIVKKTDMATLLPIIQQFVDEDSTIVTDELSAYNGLNKSGYNHITISHRIKEYVVGDIFTTNNMRDFGATSAG